jgi:uncharacterized metal-binding protein YceD (DUF177 family)
MMSALERPFTIDLCGLKDGRHDRSLMAPGNLLELPADLLVVDGEVALELEVSVTGTLIRARGTVRAEAGLTCGRCLEPFRENITAEVDIVLRSGTNGIRMEDEDETAPFIGDNWVALDAPVREALILGVPMRPLCRPECRGLCPQCGENLNLSTCSCRPEPADARWEALRSLLDEKEED